MIRGLFLAILLVAAVVAAEIHVPTSVALAAAEVKPQPEYGAMARQLKVAGDVAIEVHISVAGEVGEVKVLAGNALLAGSVVKTLKNWRFKPFLSEGQPTAAVTILKFSFK